MAPHRNVINKEMDRKKKEEKSVSHKALLPNLVRKNQNIKQPKSPTANWEATIEQFFHQQSFHSSISSNS
jgi:hypothetical protein